LTIFKGTEARLGGLGGCAGDGGQGGLAGKIEITTQKEQNEVKVKAVNGRPGACGKAGRTGDSDCRDGTDSYVVKDAFGQPTCTNTKGNYKYEIAHSETARKASIFDDTNEVFVFAKRSHDVSEKRSRSADHEFFVNLVSVLRNAYNDFDYVVKILNLKSYRNGVISILDVARNCQLLNHDIPHLKTLKRVAQTVSHEDLVVKTFIQKQIRAFILPKIVTVEGNSVEISKKIIASADIEEFFTGHDEIRVICDTFHVDKDLPTSARGKNLAVLANFVEVHGNVVWNLSGKERVRMQHFKAGQGESGGIFLSSNQFLPKNITQKTAKVSMASMERRAKAAATVSLPANSSRTPCRCGSSRTARTELTGRTRAMV
jgi:hypothetical protein